ncbi:hypothetical protein PV325_008365 [Microctonus aethiopoides]|uniref:Uncharacterized protein n=1 Tax=Microctonus aethiopoides TaxID=144406 RepID=A0AA39F8Q2_9HYME|nr:hypothetical protein PV325_008365 [Microctonus aethiopoides]KAK0164953.1 hypothetical protein PV328_003516 [Microctonus aethiopoides]
MYGDNLTNYASGNELWHGILRDCSKTMSFSCIQKNAYTYLDNAFVERDNITIFDGLTMRKNNLNYNTCTKDCRDDSEVEDNLVEGLNNVEGRNTNENGDETLIDEEEKSPLEEITLALREKAVKFLSTRDYEIELPKFFFESSKIKISPREIDENGALVRIDFGQRAVENYQGRIFLKKIRKFIQNRLLVSFLALLLVIKLVKVKFMFIIPFLFGVGTAKKIFLKLLLFLIPAFAHVFKLCSSYYTSHSKYHHHHHHKIAHHHHHVPVPVPVPAFVDHHHPHHPHHEEEFNGYDYAHPHIQIRKDIEELKEWGIDSFTESYDDPALRPAAPQSLPAPQSPQYPTTYGIPQYPAIVKPSVLASPQQFPINAPSHGQTLAYSGYLDNNNQKLNRRIAVQNISPVAPQVFTNTPIYKHGQSNIPATPQIKSSAPALPIVQQNRVTPQQVVSKTSNTNYPNDALSSSSSVSHTSNAIVVNDDNFYKPIIDKLDSIFSQLRFSEESCRERLICSMYKNPAVYSPHSNIVSNELSSLNVAMVLDHKEKGGHWPSVPNRANRVIIDPQELKRATNGSAAGKRFHRYIDAARSGQEGGDCLRIYPCHINTE